MMSQFRLEGADGLERLIASLPAKMAKKGIRRAVRIAHRIVYDSILQKIQALPSSGLLKRRSLKLAMLLNFRIRTPRRQQSGTYAMEAAFENAESAGLVHYAQGSHASIAGTRAKETGRSFIPAALEYGHGSSKEAAARPFMRPGFESAQDKTQRTLAAELANELDLIVREAGGQAA